MYINQKLFKALRYSFLTAVVIVGLVTIIGTGEKPWRSSPPPVILIIHPVSCKAWWEPMLIAANFARSAAEAAFTAMQNLLVRRKQQCW